LLKGLKRKEGAVGAKPILKLLALAPEFARIFVSLRHAAPQALTTFLANVLSAVPHSKLTSTEPLKAAHQNVLVRSSQEQEVYNLTVDGCGMYIADDLIVSNCDADRYLTISLYNSQGVKFTPKVPNNRGEGPPREDLAARIEWLKRRGKTRVVL
jgi:hypothetical protein